MERTEGGCAVEVVCGEEAERWSRAENIRNWRKVRNGAFSWLSNSCNFYCHCWVPGHQARRVGKGHVTTSPQIRIWHLHAQEARRIEGPLIYRLADELNEITKMHFSCIRSSNSIFRLGEFPIIEYRPTPTADCVPRLRSAPKSRAEGCCFSGSSGILLWRTGWYHTTFSWIQFIWLYSALLSGICNHLFLMTF